MKYYLCDMDGRSHGPYAVRQIKQKQEAGDIPSHTYIAAVGSPSQKLLTPDLLEELLKNEHQGFTWAMLLRLMISLATVGAFFAIGYIAYSLLKEPEKRNPDSYLDTVHGEGDAPTPLPSPKPSQSVDVVTAKEKKFDASAVKPSVVLLLLSGVCEGSGFVVAYRDNAAIIATNYHVVKGRKEGNTVHVLHKCADGSLEYFPGTVFAEDADHDLALVRAEGLNAKPLELHRNEPAVGEEVYAIGFPGIAKDSESGEALFKAIGKLKGKSGVLQDPTGDASRYVEAMSTFGVVNIIVSKDWRNVQGGTKAREKFRIIGHQANIAPGNSGGPLCCKCGHVYGVNTAGVSHDKGQLEEASHTCELIKLMQRNRIEPIFKNED